MKTVFIAGSISIRHLHEKVRERINKIASSADLNVVVGDADGADASIQQCLHDYRATKVTVYCTGDTPRNNVADWPVRRVHSKERAGSRAFFTAKDLEMARGSDYGLMIWDCKSTGTLSNVIELLREKKKSVVFVNKKKDFVTIADKTGLDHLLRLMSEHARKRAEEKIDLSAKLAEMDQLCLDIASECPSNKPHKNKGDDFSELIAGDTVQAESMKLRSELISVLKEYIHCARISQSQAAKIFGVAQSRISDLIRGKVDLFGLDTLVNMASTAGLHVEIHVHKKLRDEHIAKC